MSKELLLEIGTEEIPAEFLPKTLTDMKRLIESTLKENRIQHGAVITMATPRRLLVCVKDVAERQEDQIVEKMGPAKRVAFDEEGNPSKAALGFARGQGIDMSEVQIVKTDKGEYICARKEIKGNETTTILSTLLPDFIKALPFKKSMRWMDLSFRFVRPIHWILALYGGSIIPFTIENITSGNTSQGHRFMGPGIFEVSNFEEYLKKTKELFVIVDHEERKNMILKKAREAAESVNGKLFENDDLLEEITYLVEFPSAVCGSFDKEYLELPKEVLTTSMIEHQKYFPVVDKTGNLLPHFIAINNTLTKDPTVVTKGNEKVIRARLADARFFFEEDRKVPLEKHVNDLKNVTFHSLLGTSYEKVMRFKELAEYIVTQINPAIKEAVSRAAYLCKADLETQMVYEFTNLQGIMGREYALISGEKPIVATAIYEHYLPIAAGGDLPGTDEGSIVSIADKMDTIVGCFGVNLIPTGTADPYALRRQSLGIINIILNKNYSLNLEDIIDKSLGTLKNKLKRPSEDTKADILEFFKGRFENQLISQGHPYDVVDAVLSVEMEDFVSAYKKIEAMEEFKKHADFEPLAIAFKRAGNIIKGQNTGFVDSSLFEAAEEKNLYNTFLQLKEKTSTFIDNHRYTEALIEMAGIRKPVDKFFENILVMDKNEAVKFNRLSMLNEISVLIYRIADFSKIVTES